MEKAFASIIAKAMALADTVSDQWLVIQYYGTDSALCNILDPGSVMQNITTTECGSTLISSLSFIIEHVILWATPLIADVMVGINGVYVY